MIIDEGRKEYSLAREAAKKDNPTFEVFPYTNTINYILAHPEKYPKALADIVLVDLLGAP